MNNQKFLQKFSHTALLIGLIFIVAGCEWIDSSRATPTSEHTGILINLNFEKTLSPTTIQTLQIYPIREGSTWIYEYLGFDLQGEVLWKVVETVVETRIVEGYYIAEITRTKEHLDGEIPLDFPNTPEVGSLWLLVDENNVYQLNSPWEPDLANASLELILPFPEEVEGWYPNSEQRNQTAPGKLGFSQASEAYQQALPSGEIYTCYNVGTQIDDGIQEGTFCDTVGYVYKELKYFHESFGYRVELVGFSLP